MNRSGVAWFVAGAALALSIAAMISLALLRGGARELEGEDAEFIRAVDLRPLDRAAVMHEGRLKSYDSFAQEILSSVSGRKLPLGQPADFAYLDMIIRPERYAEAPIIFIKNKNMRAQVAAALQRSGRFDEERGRRLIEDGLASEPDLRDPAVSELMNRWAQDVVRTAKHVDAVEGARALARRETLLSLLRIVPDPQGRADRPWIPLSELWRTGATLEAAEAPAGGLDPELKSALERTLLELATGWRAKDATMVNASVARLAEQLPSVAPGIYPEATRMALQSWYFRSANMTWVWLIYLTSMVLLLMSVVYRWERARWAGMGVFGVAFALHTLALGWRWYVSGRWPNSNMFEAVTTSVWLGAVAVIGLEIAARRTPMRNLFALGGAGASMCALMAAHYIPELNPSINNMMPVLHDLWLYIHTNVIIASYALIAMAAVTAGLYLAHRAMGGSAEYARVGGAAALMEIGDERGDPLASGRRVSLGEVFDGATMVLMELSFVLLWAGIVMGAIWADHSWGRPWGWDPKEVFALNTFIVFLVLVHVRLKVRDKGLWTAILAIIGCAVMLFNWIVINFVISGLHSYA
ncbi:MAG: cytochrome c biogenesis protein CcsA [Planctomycetota bacterium]|nr:cytochrome c biogenesis protein CcsA [Planctomycetota bacterium]